MGAASGDRWDKGHSMRSSRTNGRGAHDVVLCVGDSVGQPHCFASWRSAREPMAERGESRQTWRFSPKAVESVCWRLSIVFSLSHRKAGPKGDEPRRGQFYTKREGLLFLTPFLIFRLLYILRPHFNNFLLAPPFDDDDDKNRRGQQQHLPFSDWKDNCHSNVEFRFSWNRITWTIVLGN